MSVPIGKFGRPHGTKGEIRLFLHNPESEVLRPGLELELLTEPEPDEEGEPPLRVGDTLLVEQARPADRFVILKLAGVDYRDQAEWLRNLEVAVAREDLPELEEDEYYQADLVGFAVHGRQSTDEPVGEIGVLEDFLDGVDTDVMVVTGPRIAGRLLVPMLGHVIEEIDLEQRRVVVAALDLWAPEDEELLP